MCDTLFACLGHKRDKKINEKRKRKKRLPLAFAPSNSMHDTLFTCLGCKGNKK